MPLGMAGGFIPLWLLNITAFFGIVFLQTFNPGHKGPEKEAPMNRKQTCPIVSATLSVLIAVLASNLGGSLPSIHIWCIMYVEKPQTTRYFHNSTKWSVIMNWLEQPRIMCPDCGSSLGNTASDGTIQIVTTLGMPEPRECVHVEFPRSNSEPQCPRLLEAIEAAKLSHN